MSKGHRFVLGLIGVILLLPGLCSLFFMATLGVGNMTNSDMSIYGLWAITFLIGAGGIFFLRKAFR